MAKDYAKYANRSRAPKKNRKMDFIILFLVVVLCGVGYGFYKYHQEGLAGTMLSFFHHSNHLKDNQSKNIKPVSAPEQPQIHFNFYNELPAMQVKIPLATNQANTSQVIANKKAATQTYVLQLAIYNNLNKASEARISFLLAGADVDVVKIGDNYRIQQGAFASLAQAKAMQNKLRKKGIESTVIKSTS